MSDITLFNQDGRILASSRDVAEKFGKRHDHILRDIESFQKDIPILGRCFLKMNCLINMVEIKRFIG